MLNITTEIIRYSILKKKNVCAHKINKLSGIRRERRAVLFNKRFELEQWRVGDWNSSRHKAMSTGYFPSLWVVMVSSLAPGSTCTAKTATAVGFWFRIRTHAVWSLTAVTPPSSLAACSVRTERIKDGYLISGFNIFIFCFALFLFNRIRKPRGIGTRITNWTEI